MSKEDDNDEPQIGRITIDDPVILTKSTREGKSKSLRVADGLL